MPATSSHEIVLCGVPFDHASVDSILREIKHVGFTGVQLYTFWRDFEPDARGRFSWDLLDPQVRAIQDAGLKYVPFILMGPRYAAPQWWLADPGHVGLRCLEHGKESPVESVWNPAFDREVARVVKGLADHYLPWGVIESVQPGIGGDYGEAIYPCLGNWPGMYHTHRGFWCGGADARADLRQQLMARHKSIETLNRRWRTAYKSFAEVQPFLPHEAPSRTARFDLIMWYRDSMTRYAGRWMAACRAAFPETPVYLCTGGSDDERTTGALFAAQAKVAAQHGAGVRLTNEGNTFAYNFPLTTHTHAACAHYGAYLGLEPVGPITEAGVRTRMFGSAAFGNRQVFHYYANIFKRDGERLPGAAQMERYAHLIQENPAEKGISFFWPIDQATLEGTFSKELHEALLYLRRQYPVTALSEDLILDGALDAMKCLVMVQAECARAEVLERIAAWVKAGGLLLSVQGPAVDLEMRRVPAFDEIFGLSADSEDAWGHHSQWVTPTEPFPRISAIRNFHAEHGWMNLLPETELLSCSKRGPGGGAVPLRNDTVTEPISALFRQTHPGGGQAILFCGTVRFEQDPEAMFADPGVITALLDDICRQTGIEPLGTRPEEHARARIGGKLLALTRDGIDETKMDAKN